MLIWFIVLIWLWIFEFRVCFIYIVAVVLWWLHVGFRIHNLTFCCWYGLVCFVGNWLFGNAFVYDCIRFLMDVLIDDFGYLGLQVLSLEFGPLGLLGFLLICRDGVERFAVTEKWVGFVCFWMWSHVEKYM